VIEAAGGAIWRRTSTGGVEILLVHRPRYDDWTLPKGKLEAGETAAAAALREVLEETGLRCAAGVELPSVRYVDHNGRAKQVRYWAMQVVDGAFEPNDEVDEVRWLGIDEAVDELTYRHDRAVLDADLWAGAHGGRAGAPTDPVT
jgi:8-oxo-dGTP pyrophosphatase MutT (NUDIX family)